MISSEISDKNIVVANYSGAITLEEITNFYIELSSKYPSLKSLLMIQDERSANFTETPEIIQNAKNLVEILARHFQSIRIAVIQDRPVETAYSFLFLENSSKLNYFIKVFSVEENARLWLESFI